MTSKHWVYVVQFALVLGFVAAWQHPFGLLIEVASGVLCIWGLWPRQAAKRADAALHGPAVRETEP